MMSRVYCDQCHAMYAGCCPEHTPYEQLMDMFSVHEERISREERARRTSALKKSSISKKEKKGRTPRRKARDDDDECEEESKAPMCTICYESLDRKTGVTALKCGHPFHTKCIDTWITSGPHTNFCPVCREENK